MSYNVDILDRFERLRKRGRIAHAYFFAGPAGSGKMGTVLAIAKLLNCEAPQGAVFCGECGSCRKIDAGNHPDIMVLSAGVGETIKIDDIRGFIQRIQLRAFEAQWKVFVLNHAERLTKEASNSVLKTLEEPNRQTLLFLTSSQPELCLDTIRSRCQMVHFFPEPYARVAERLRNEAGVNEDAAQALAFFAQGSFSGAQVLIESKFSARKNKIIDEIVMKKDSDEFIRKVLSDKEETQTLLKVLLSFFRDLTLVKCGISEEKVANRDRIRDIRMLVSKFSMQDLDRVVHEIVKAMGLFKDNLNVKMSLSVIKELVWVK